MHYSFLFHKYKIFITQQLLVHAASYCDTNIDQRKDNDIHIVLLSEFEYVFVRVSHAQQMLHHVFVKRLCTTSEDLNVRRRAQM